MLVVRLHCSGCWHCHGSVCVAHDVCDGFAGALSLRMQNLVSQQQRPRQQSHDIDSPDSRLALMVNLLAIENSPSDYDDDAYDDSNDDVIDANDSM